ncbi:MAG: biotin--[acetyl-CoA-carboxylase] ligase [Actinomycetota bacterium]
MQASDATSTDENFAASRAAAAIVGWSFAYVSTTGSTNADLAERARAGDRRPALLTTDHQTAGRGRLGRTWEDDGESQLMVSFSIPVTGPATWVAGAVAAAARDVVAAAGAPVGFKWPNDLMIESTAVSGKLAGVLAEFVPGDPDVVIVGMGLNIGPPGIDGAASLREAGATIERDELLAGIIARLPTLVADPDLVRSSLTDHSVTLGRRVRVEQSSGAFVGTATTFDQEGRLVVDVDGESRVVAVGDVIHLRAEG